MDNKKAIVLELSVNQDKYIFPNSISEALVKSSDELKDLDDQLNETLETIKNLTPNCDKYDYILSASSGALCGIIDIFLVGKPGESPLGNITDVLYCFSTVFANGTKAHHIAKSTCNHLAVRAAVTSAFSYFVLFIACCAVNARERTRAGEIVPI